MRKIVSEFLATFTLLLAILEGIAIAATSHSSSITLWTAAIVSGAAVTILIYGFSKHSGAHMNPAVSTAMWLDNQLSTGMLFGYAIAQLAGSWLAAWVIDATHAQGMYVMGETIPHINLDISLTQMEYVALFIELAATFILILTIFRFSDDNYPKMKKAGPVVIGLVVTIAILVTGPYSGGSMNPARSFGPAMIDNESVFLWIYFIAPLTAAPIARYFDLWLRKKIGKKKVEEVMKENDVKVPVETE